MQTLITLGVVLLLSFLGFYFPEFFARLKPAVVPLLALVMLSMGLTLKEEDFLRVFKRPYQIAYAGLLQFSLMPLLGYGLAHLLRVEKELLYGAVLLGSAPGGTASNVITYLSKGDVAYSVSMTTMSTLLSPLATPVLTYLLIGKRVEVDLTQMAKDVLLITVLPVLVGLLLRKFLPSLLRLEKFLPFLAVVGIGIIIGVVLALNKDKIGTVGPEVLALVMLHNLLGFVLGYLLGLLAGLDRKQAKTLSIEVGVQNSGLAVVLALKYLSPLSALPAALFSLLQNINGLLLSLLYRRL